VSPVARRRNLHHLADRCGRRGSTP
jgi:hypothetical protein